MISDYDPAVAKGSMRGVNEIDYAYWKHKTQWVHIDDYNYSKPADMPLSFMSFLAKRFSKIDKKVEDYFALPDNDKQNKLHIMQGSSKLPSLKTFIFEYKGGPECCKQSLSDVYEKGDADWRVGWHGTRMECVFATAVRRRLEPGPRCIQGKRAVYMFLHARATKATHYATWIPLFDDGMFYRAIWELRTDYHDRIGGTGSDQHLSRERTTGHGGKLTDAGSTGLGCNA